MKKKTRKKRPAAATVDVYLIIGRRIFRSLADVERAAKTTRPRKAAR